MKKLLVQACCGCCATSFEKGDVTYFFNGDNFDTINEYKKRLEAMLTVDKDCIVEGYEAKVFDSCEECIAYRLRRCAEVALERGFDCFTTTLTVSPHKDSAMVNRIGREVAAEVGVPFLELDLKKNNGFAKSVARSKQLGLYRQRYCGCGESRRLKEPVV